MITQTTDKWEEGLTISKILDINLKRFNAEWLFQYSLSDRINILRVFLCLQKIYLLFDIVKSNEKIYIGGTIVNHVYKKNK
jgi:hypothetical protein